MPTKQTTRSPATNFTERNKMKTTKELLESITKSKVARRNKLTGGNPKRDISSQEVKDQMAASVKATLDKFEQEKKAEAAKKIGVRKESDESTLTQALDILEDLESEEEIAEFLETLDEDTYAEVENALNEVELDEISQDTARSYAQKAKVSQKKLVAQTWSKDLHKDDVPKLVNKIEKRQDGLNRALSDKRYYKESTLEKAISNYRSINEGTWTLTSKDGIQKRFKDDKSQAAKDWVSGNQKKEKIMSAKVPKAAAVSLDTIWRKVEDVVGNIYPDGDPIDYLGPWCKKQGIDYSMVDKAAKKHGFKDVYAYWDSMSEHLG